MVGGEAGNTSAIDQGGKYSRRSRFKKDDEKLKFGCVSFVCLGLDTQSCPCAALPGPIVSASPMPPSVPLAPHFLSPPLPSLSCSLAGPPGLSSHTLDGACLRDFALTVLSAWNALLPGVYSKVIVPYLL